MIISPGGSPDHAACDAEIARLRAEAAELRRTIRAINDAKEADRG